MESATPRPGERDRSAMQERISMKHGRKLKSSWYVPPEALDETTFACRACGATLTKNLRRQRFLDTHAHDYTGPLVPDDAYWIVAQGHLPTRFDGRQIDFMGCYAVHPEALVGVGKHPDPERWIGCCGPSGTGGPNRVCTCGRAIGTERSDCMWPIAIYLDPKNVRPTIK
jgi:hypothetical protein